MDEMSADLNVNLYLVHWRLFFSHVFLTFATGLTVHNNNLFLDAFRYIYSFRDIRFVHLSWSEGNQEEDGNWQIELSSTLLMSSCTSLSSQIALTKQDLHPAMNGDRRGIGIIHWVVLQTETENQ